MNRETINRVLELTELRNQLNDLGSVLHYHNATKITITNNTGISKNFDCKMIEALSSFCEEKQREVDNEFEKL